MRSLLGRALMVGGLLVLGMVMAWGSLAGRAARLCLGNVFQPSSPANVNSGDYCHFYEEQQLASNLHVRYQ